MRYTLDRPIASYLGAKSIFGTLDSFLQPTPFAKKEPQFVSWCHIGLLKYILGLLNGYNGGYFPYFAPKYSKNLKNVTTDRSLHPTSRAFHQTMACFPTNRICCTQKSLQNIKIAN